MKTFREAKDGLWNHLAQSGWSMSGRLKVPHATSPDRVVRLWFKPQAIWYSMGSHQRAEHSLWVDVRTENPQEIERQAYAVATMHRNGHGFLLVNIILPDGEQRAVQCASEEQCAKVIRAEAKRRPATTLFHVVAEEDDGSIGVIDRWYVDGRGTLVHHPHRRSARQAAVARRGYASLSATRPHRDDITLEMATRRAR